MENNFKYKIEEIIEKVDIVEIISEYVNLKKTGKNYKALCPFHAEENPSFFVNPEKQIFHCFGCGIGGNVIKFLMNIEKISFYEALQKLAQKAGIEIRREKTFKENIERKRIIEANKYACKLYNQILFSPYGKYALEYLYQRNFKDEEINRFSLGFAPSDNILLRKIEEGKLPKEDFILSALLDEEGKQDTFRNRIIFPIFNMKGEIIGFGGRTIEDGVMPKYLNIRENLVFDKGKCFYGINWANEEIKLKGFAILVEGYFDVLKLQVNQIRNCIAPMGTAITENHLKILKKLTSKILLLFDGDDAGIRATLRNLENILREGFEVKICMLPAGFDPDKFIDEYGVEPFYNFMNNSQNFIDFFISISSQMYDFTNPKEKSTAVKQLVKLISNIPDEIEKYEFLKKVAEKFDVKIDILEKYLEEVFYVDEKNSVELNKISENIQLKAEKLLIEILLSDKKYWEKIFQWENKLTERIDKIILSAKNLIEKGLEPTPSFLVSECNDEQLSNYISSIAIKNDNKISEEKAEKVFTDCIKNLYKIRISKEIEKTKKNLNEKKENEDEYKEELKKVQELLQELKNLSKKGVKNG